MGSTGMNCVKCEFWSAEHWCRGRRLLLTDSWTFMSSKELDGASYDGEISEYGGGGFTQVLPLEGSEAMDVIQYLKDNMWIDRGTRAVFLDFTVYNANINLFCVVR